MASCFVYKKSKLRQTTSNELLEGCNNTERGEKSFVMRVAMLGLSETGKSTIVKSMKMLFKDTYDSQADRIKYRIVISRNILNILKAMIRKTQKKGLKMDEYVQISAARILMYHMQSDMLPPDMVSDIKNVWIDFKKSYHDRMVDMSSVENAPHYMDSIERICATNYIPTVDDILKCSTKTTTISEVDFSAHNVSFKVIDMGGHRHERSKWRKGMEEAGAIMFCVALTDYDQPLQEDPKSNRMHESLATFKNIVQSFPNRLIFICFTKRTLFASKIKRVPLGDCFPDYEGGGDYTKALEFIMQQFSNIANSDSLHPQKTYASVINATDPKEIHYMVKNSVKVIKKIYDPQIKALQ